MFLEHLNTAQFLPASNVFSESTKCTCQCSKFGHEDLLFHLCHFAFTKRRCGTTYKRDPVVTALNKSLTDLHHDRVSFRQVSCGIDEGGVRIGMTQNARSRIDPIVGADRRCQAVP